MEDECPMVEEKKNPYVKNPYVDNLQTFEYYINEKPTLYDTIKYY